MATFGRLKPGLRKKAGADLMARYVPGFSGAPAVPGAPGVPATPGAPSASVPLMSMLFGQKPSEPQTLPTEATGGPEAAPSPAEAPYKPSGWAVLDRVLGGDTITEARRRLVNEHSADEASQSQMATLQAALAGITDPRERIAFLLNPTEYGKSLSSRYGAQNVTGGNTVVYGQGGPTYTAPKVEMSGDSGVVLTPDKMTVLGSRPISQAGKLAEDRLAEDKRYHDMSIDARLEQIRKPPAPRGGGRGSAKPKPWEREY